MDKLVSRIKILIPDIIFVVLMASCISLALISSLLINLSYFYVLKITIFAAFLFLLVFWNAITVLTTFSVVSSGLVVFISLFDKNSTASKIIYYVIEAFNRVYSYIFGDGNINGLEHQIALFIIFTVVFFMFFVILKFKLYNFVIIFGGAFFAVQSINGFTIKYLPFYIYMLTMVLIYFYGIKKDKNRSLVLFGRANNMFLLSVIPIALIIFLLAFMLPYDKDPVQVPWLDNKVARLSNYITDTYDDYRNKNDFFSLTQMGFGDDGRLGGSVTQNNIEVLEVNATKPVYLKAIGKDIYTGSGWKDSLTDRKSLMDIEGYNADELIEMNFGLKLLNYRNQYNFDNLFMINKMEISFLNLKTKSLFIPKGLILLNAQDNNITADDNITTSMENLKKKGFNYQIVAQTPKYESAAFSQLLLNSYNGFYRSLMRRQNIPWQWDSYINVQGSLYMPYYNKYIRLADYAQKADRIRTAYTVLPDELPQRVRDLAVKITEGKRTNYEKAKAIEKYLSESYPYTLDPGETPKGRDFVDYFLFEQKQGYCAHYASAMTVLARAVGLPARYVEGFRMQNESRADEKYIITNNSAHSWVEIYFEGAGWVPFEPTAAYNQDFYRQDEITYTNGEETVTDEAEPTPDTSDILTDDAAGGSEETQGPSRLTVMAIYTAVTIVVILILMLVITVINFERHRHRIKKYKKLPASRAMVKLYEELLKIMKKAGYGIQDNETAIQYGKRIDGMFYIRPVNFEKISINFTEARYGGRQIDAEKVEEFDKIYTCLLEIYKQEKGKLLYLIQHYILGTI